MDELYCFFFIFSYNQEQEVEKKNDKVVQTDERKRKKSKKRNVCWLNWLKYVCVCECVCFSVITKVNSTMFQCVKNKRKCQAQYFDPISLPETKQEKKNVKQL